MRRLCGEWVNQLLRLCDGWVGGGEKLRLELTSALVRAELGKKGKNLKVEISKIRGWSWWDNLLERVQLRCGESFR